jgi:hypothetical protein
MTKAKLFSRGMIFILENNSEDTSKCLTTLMVG